MRIFYVYIITNKTNHVFYIGITNDLIKRTFEHKSKINPGFTNKYNVNKLVYFEDFLSPYEAIRREKEIKGWLRKKKIKLIRANNPAYIDLSQDWY
ncbi:MAG: endonuclease [Parcubacteria group bacterium]|nr:endonuclease [Parcubacteria group bacterium]|tara:strand:+ start:4777 stop:5064 length:288 start_codon:yes stop_codon:yes gene_type:complete